MRKHILTIAMMSMALTACRGSVIDYSRLDDLAEDMAFMESEYFDCERYATEEECDAAYAEYEQGYEYGLGLADELDPEKDDTWLYNQCLPLPSDLQFKDGLKSPYTEGCLDAVGYDGELPE